MQVGVNITRMTSMEDIEATVDRLEGVGVDHIWLPDHLMGYYHPQICAELPGSQGVPTPEPASYVWDGDGWLDPFCAAATLGRRTGITIGTCVTDGTRRRGGDLARTVLTLSQANRGEFILSIGAGEAMSLTPFGFRADRTVGNMESTLRDLRSILDTGRMPTGSGRLGLELDGPNGRPRVWVAANSPRTLKLAGRYGDGWIHLGASREMFEQQREVVRAEAEAAGRPVPTAAIVVLCILGESRAAVIETLDRSPLIKSIMLCTPAAHWAAFGLEHPAGPQSRGLLDLLPHDLDVATIRETAPTIPTEMLEQFLVIGSAVEVEARLRPMVDAGIDHAIFTDVTASAYPPGQADALQLEYGTLAHLLRQGGSTPVPTASERQGVEV